MLIDSKSIVSIDEAMEDFARVARIAREDGQTIIFEDNKPKYVLIDIARASYIDLTEDEKVDIVAKRILKEHHDAFVELAK